MILKGGIPGVIAKPGPNPGHGITPAQIASAGTSPSPLLNDVDPGDTLTELIWALLPTLVASGTTQVNDAGGYALIGAADGTWVQGYRLLAMPATGATYVGESVISTVFGTSSPGGRVADPDFTIGRGEWNLSAFRVRKQPRESRDIIIEMGPWFAGRADDPASVSVVAATGITVTAALSGTRINMLATGGTDGQVFNVPVLMQTDATPPVIREFDLIIEIQEVQ